jgi:hypothetical protein
MKKIALSVGAIAIGAGVVHAAESSTLNQYQQTKAWSVQASLRGFYDDNIGTQPKGDEVDSFGIQFNPSINYGHAGEQTSFNLGYSLSARFYEEEIPGRTDKEDFTHTFEADLSHAFSPRLSLYASEAFVIGQEPDVLRDPAGTIRQQGDNMRNFFNVDLELGVTELLGFQFGYGNSWYDYDDEGPTINGGGFVTQPSSSGLLDRMEHVVNIDSQWKLSPQTLGIIGYAFSSTAFDGDEVIGGDTTAPLPGFEPISSDDRDSRGHTLYVGAQHIFSPTLSGNFKLGGQYYDYINDPANESQWSPYLQGGLTYKYQEATTIDVGFSYSRTAANESGSSLGGGGLSTSFVRDTEMATIFATFKRQLTERLTGSLGATFQDATYNATGDLDGDGFLYTQLSANLNYKINPTWSASASYHYDDMDSDLPGRTYDRNRVHVGVTAGF